METLDQRLTVAHRIQEELLAANHIIDIFIQLCIRQGAEVRLFQDAILLLQQAALVKDINSKGSKEKGNHTADDIQQVATQVVYVKYNKVYGSDHRVQRYHILFASEIGRHFTPLLCFPLDDGVTPLVGLKPSLGTGDNLEERLRLRGALQFRLTLPFADP